MEQEYRGALFVAAIGAIGWLIRTIYSSFQRLKAKISELKSAEESALNRRIETLTTQLSTNSVAVIKLESKLEDFKSLVGTVDKLARDVQALHTWRRTKFPDVVANGSHEDPSKK